MLKSRDYIKQYFTVLKARGKRALADVVYCCKMTSVMMLDGVMLFLRLKDITNTWKCMGHSPTIGGTYSVQWRKVGRICVFLVNCVLESK